MTCSPPAVRSATSQSRRPTAQVGAAADQAAWLTQRFAAAPISSAVHMVEKKITHSAYDTVRLVAKVGAQAVHNVLPTDPTSQGISKPDYKIDHDSLRKQKAGHKTQNKP